VASVSCVDKEVCELWFFLLCLTRGGISEVELYEVFILLVH